MTAYSDNGDLNRAIAALTVQEVWRRAGLADCPREGNHLVKSPFREDRKKSFSICFKGAGWRDHADGSRGGVWAFAKLATGKDGQELADWLIEASGITRTPPPRRTEDGGQTTEAFKPSRRMKPKPYPSPAVKAQLAAEHARALESRVVVRDVSAWSAAVEARWLGATDFEWAAQDVAESRGWPVAWAIIMHDEGKLAWPLLPWHDSPRECAARGCAFLVEQPVFGNSSLSTLSFQLRPVGYHQRFINGAGDKSWLYVPYLPQVPKSDFQRALVASGGEDFRGTPGLPFVLPGGAECSALIITEGQWDAITFAGACGWLDSDTAWPEGWWVMGSRGSNGADTLLAYWGPWLRRWKPRVLLMTDNDAAGLWWDHAHMAGDRAPWLSAWEPGVVPSFKEKLEALGCAVVVKRVAASIGKDFNDYYKAKKPTPAAMAKWLAATMPL